MKQFFLRLLSVGLTMAAATSSMIGDWNIVEIFDENDAPVSFPQDRTFTMNMKPEEDRDHNPTDGYKFGIKVGNRLMGHIDYDMDDDSYTFGPIMSTMMMPEEPLWKLEVILTNTLPKVTQIQMDTDDALEFIGDGGQIKFDRASEE